MKTLNWYVTHGFVAVLGVSLGVLTFTMVAGNLIKVFEAVAQGVSFGSAMLFMIYMLPMALTFTIPWAILVSVLIVFGRLSADNEITAMRACGVSIFQIISPIIILTFALTCVCLWLQARIAPLYMGKARDLLEVVGMSRPDALIEPGVTVTFGSMDIMVKDKTANNELKDLQIYCFDKRRTRLVQDITAIGGKLQPDKDGGLTILLRDFTIIDYKDKLYGSRLAGDSMALKVDMGRRLNDREVHHTLAVMTLNELLGYAALYRKVGKDTTEIELTLNGRLAIALSPIAFLLLGLPLAIRASRRETFVGFFLSVVLAGAYFFTVIGVGNLYSKPELRPQLLVWIPNIVYQIGGLFILCRVTLR